MITELYQSIVSGSIAGFVCVIAPDHLIPILTFCSLTLQQGQWGQQQNKQSGSDISESGQGFGKAQWQSQNKNKWWWPHSDSKNSANSNTSMIIQQQDDIEDGIWLQQQDQEHNQYQQNQQNYQLYWQRRWFGFKSSVLKAWNDWISCLIQNLEMVKSSFSLGFQWGTGHSTGVLVLLGLLFLMKLSMGQSAFEWLIYYAQLCIGVVLFYLGATYYRQRDKYLASFYSTSLEFEQDRIMQWELEDWWHWGEGNNNNNTMNQNDFDQHQQFQIWWQDNVNSNNLNDGSSGSGYAINISSPARKKHYNQLNSNGKIFQYQLPPCTCCNIGDIGTGKTKGVHHNNQHLANSWASLANSWANSWRKHIGSIFSSGKHSSNSNSWSQNNMSNSVSRTLDLTPPSENRNEHGEAEDLDDLDDEFLCSAWPSEAGTDWWQQFNSPTITTGGITSWGFSRGGFGQGKFKFNTMNSNRSQYAIASSSSHQKIDMSQSEDNISDLELHPSDNHNNLNNISFDAASVSTAWTSSRIKSMFAGDKEMTPDVQWQFLNWNSKYKNARWEWDVDETNLNLVNNNQNSDGNNQLIEIDGERPSTNSKLSLCSSCRSIFTLKMYRQRHDCMLALLGLFQGLSCPSNLMNLLFLSEKMKFWLVVVYILSYYVASCVFMGLWCLIVRTAWTSYLTNDDGSGNGNESEGQELKWIEEFQYNFQDIDSNRQQKQTQTSWTWNTPLQFQQWKNQNQHLSLSEQISFWWNSQHSSPLDDDGDGEVNVEKTQNDAQAKVQQQKQSNNDNSYSLSSNARTITSFKQSNGGNGISMSKSKYEKQQLQRVEKLKQFFNLSCFSLCFLGSIIILWSLVYPGRHFHFSDLFFPHAHGNHDHDHEHELDLLHFDEHGQGTDTHDHDHDHSTQEHNEQEQTWTDSTTYTYPYAQQGANSQGTSIGVLDSPDDRGNDKQRQIKALIRRATAGNIGKDIDGALERKPLSSDSQSDTGIGIDDDGQVGFGIANSYGQIVSWYQSFRDRGSISSSSLMQSKSKSQQEKQKQFQSSSYKNKSQQKQSQETSSSSFNSNSDSDQNTNSNKLKQSQQNQKQVPLMWATLESGSISSSAISSMDTDLDTYHLADDNDIDNVSDIYRPGYLGRAQAQGQAQNLHQQEQQFSLRNMGVESANIRPVSVS